MSLVFHYHPLASYCHKALIALYENATPFQFRMLGPDTPDNAAEWLRRWPLRRFPLLVDDGRSVVESSIIIEYLQQRHAGPVRLLPDAPEAALPTGFSNALMHNPALAAVYQKLWRPAFTRLFSLGGSGTLTAHNDLIADLAIGGEHRLLDIGCGPGLYTRPLAARLDGAGIAVGLDVSAAMLHRATVDNAGERIAYLRGNAVDLPFPDGTFNVVMCLAALYLMPDPWTVVREMSRVTAPGGRLACSPHWPPR